MNIIKLANMLLVLLLLFGLGCGEKKEASKREMQNAQFAKELLLKGKKETAALLSIKYNVEENVVEEIITEYTEAHSWLLGMLKNKDSNNDFPKINLNYRKTILYLSAKHSISKEKVASIILDSKKYSGGEIEDNEFMSAASEGR